MKSAKSIFDETNGLSDLMALSPSASTTILGSFLTFLFSHRNSQDSKNAGHILSLHVAILLLIESIEHLPVLLNQLRADLRLHLDFLLNFRRSSLHSITDYIQSQPNIENSPTNPQS